MKPLEGQVAVVAGATRGAGRGVARALGEAGAFVYCTGRSVAGAPSPYGRPETIDETAALIAGEGGRAAAVRVDHTSEPEVEALFARVDREHGRLDVLVDGVAGEDPRAAQWGSFWTTNFRDADAILRACLVSHMLTAKHAAGPMIRARRGLIVELTESDIMMGGGNPMIQTVKLSLKGMALDMAMQLHEHGVAAVAVTPGFLRSEAMLERVGVSEANWRDGGKADPNFLESESPLFVGRAVAALAADPRMLERTGMLWSSWELARAYGVTDYDGRRPDWGAFAIDFSGLPPALTRTLATGVRLHRAWLRDVARRTDEFAAKFPPGAGA